MSLSGFHEGRLPVPAGPGSSGGPEWRTQSLVLASGREVRNARWANARRRWDLVTPPLGRSDLAQLVDFFNARRGRLQGFRYRDVSACSTAIGGNAPAAGDQLIGQGDGEQSVFGLVTGEGSLAKRILKPVAGSLLLSIDGAPVLFGWSLDASTGEVTFDTPPATGAQIKAGFDYDWPVRFDTDVLDISHDQIGAGRVVSLPLIELF